MNANPNARTSVFTGKRVKNIAGVHRSQKNGYPMQLKKEQKAILEGFKRYIVVKGYASGFEIRLAGAVRECLIFMNERTIQELGAVTTADLKSYHNYLEHRPNKIRGGTLSPHTISGYFFALKLFFGYAQKMDFIEINPMSMLHYPRIKSKAREVLKTKAIKTLYEACENEQEKAILGLFYGCGLRKAEGEKLNVRDVDFRNGFLYVRSGKGNKRRVVPIAKSAGDDFKSYYYDFRPAQITKQTKTDDRQAFMLNKRGTRMRGNSHYDYFKKILHRTAITKSISLHHLRHSIATHLLAGGMKIEAIRDFLGHSSLESTEIYTRVRKEQLR